jgi:hypothetical protein
MFTWSFIYSPLHSTVLVLTHVPVALQHLQVYDQTSDTDSADVQPVERTPLLPEAEPDDQMPDDMMPGGGADCYAHSATAAANSRERPPTPPLAWKNAPPLPDERQVTREPPALPDERMAPREPPVLPGERLRERASREPPALPYAPRPLAYDEVYL